MLTAKEAAAEMFRAVRDARLQRDTLLMMADDLERAIVDRPAPTPTPAPGLDLDAVADTMRGLDNIFAQAMSSRDAEIARLTADLAAARAVPADVEAALCDSSCWICDREDPIRGANLDRVKAAIARAISDATVARGTVGGLLATAPVGSIVEFWHGATANQITTRVGGIDDRVWLWRYRNPNGEWSPWDYEAPSPDDLSQPGEIVPADPNQRGPLPKGG
jgi:hypothetical protein